MSGHSCAGARPARSSAANCRTNSGNWSNGAAAACRLLRLLNCLCREPPSVSARLGCLHGNNSKQAVAISRKTTSPVTETTVVPARAMPDAGAVGSQCGNGVQTAGIGGLQQADFLHATPCIGPL